MKEKKILTTEEFPTLEEVYTPRYCKQLEITYGDGFLAEGGYESVERMFANVSLHQAKALDIGSGLGVVAFYLAEKYGMHVTGLEVNRWLINEAYHRTPEKLRDRVNFLLNFSNDSLPFPDSSYDIVYSRLVLSHIEYKLGLFQECHRILKKGGHLIIIDWLSSEEKRWGKNMQTLIDGENLPIYPESESGYLQLLRESGFTIQSARDEGFAYQKYNWDVAQKLKCYEPDAIYSETELKTHIEDYEAVAKAIELKEMRVLHFVAKKE